MVPGGPWFASLRSGEFSVSTGGNCHGIVNPVIDVQTWLSHSINNANYGYYDMSKYEPAAALYEGKATHMLKRGVRVEGVVYDARGKPLADAAVAWGSDRVASNVLPEQRTATSPPGDQPRGSRAIVRTGNAAS